MRGRLSRGDKRSFVLMSPCFGLVAVFTYWRFCSRHPSVLKCKISAPQIATNSNNYQPPQSDFSVFFAAAIVDAGCAWDTFHALPVSVPDAPPAVFQPFQ